MINLIKWLIFGHIHKWEIIEKYNLNYDNGTQGHRYHLQCMECGEVISKDLG